MKPKPSVTIIFPNLNGGQEPLECLTSISRADYPQPRIETVVIDNGSTDGSDRAIAARFPRVTLLRMKQNLGFARAVNLGIRRSRGKYIFIGNDDLIFAKDSLRVLVDYAQQHPEVGLLGGKIFFKTKPQTIASSGYRMHPWTGHVYRAPHPDQIKEPDWVQGCAMLAKRSLLLRLGGLDPDYTLSFDDYDLSLRVRRAGLKVVYLPQAVFWHGESLTVDKNKPHKYFHWYRSKVRFILKHLPVWNIVSIILVQLTIATPYRAIVLRDGRFFPFLKALGWHIVNLRQTLRDRRNLRASRK